MTETQKKTAADTSSAGTATAAEKIAEAQTNLVRSFQEGGLAKQVKHVEACVEFAKTSHQLKLDTAQRASEAYTQYVREAQDVSDAENASQRLSEAYENYTATLQGLYEDSERRWQEAYGELSKKASEAAAEQQQQVRQYYVDYLKSIQRLWASVDVETLVP